MVRWPNKLITFLYYFSLQVHFSYKKEKFYIEIKNKLMDVIHQMTSKLRFVDFTVQNTLS